MLILIGKKKVKVSWSLFSPVFKDESSICLSSNKMTQTVGWGGASEMLSPRRILGPLINILSLKQIARGDVCNCCLLGFNVYTSLLQSLHFLKDFHSCLEDQPRSTRSCH